MFQLHVLNGLTFRLNIETGETWFLVYKTWIPITEDVHGGEEENV